MKIAVIQASSQKDKNDLLYNCVRKAVQNKEDQVMNLGVFAEKEICYSYVETAMQISILLESKAVDFVVTGCSSGQGMMLACNSLPGVFCGYVQHPADAYLFGRINHGNAVSLPLGLNFGWAGEIHLQCTLDKLFEEPFGTGYPKQDALRKQKDAELVKTINVIAKRSLAEVIPILDSCFMKRVVSLDSVYDHVMNNGTNKEVIALVQKYRSNNL